MQRLLLASVTLVALAACEPDYGDRVDHVGAEAQVHPTGGAEPDAVSGAVPADTNRTIHHPGADGNAGRPPDDTVGPTLGLPEGTE